MAKYCADCGEALVEMKRFCPNCGAEANAPDTSSGPEAPPPAEPSGGAGPLGAGAPRSPVLAKLISVILGLAILATIGGIYISQEDPSAAKFLDLVTDKINSIITPKAPVGDLTPSRDLRGTWKSALSRKGFQLYGSFKTGEGTISVYEDGDMELVIDSVVGNTAKGKMRITNLGVSSKATIPGGGSVSIPRRVVIRDSGYSPIAIHVSGPSLDFGSFSTSGVSGSMRGSYTTDLMSGTMTIKTQYGPIKGEFHLIRKK